MRRLRLPLLRGREVTPADDLRCACGSRRPCPLHAPARSSVVDDAADVRKHGCARCGEAYDPALSDAGDRDTYCSAECEAEDAWP